jgi:hypothetical protein
MKKLALLLSLLALGALGLTGCGGGGDGEATAAPETETTVGSGGEAATVEAENDDRLPLKERIGTKANEWAALFAAGRDSWRFMRQPAGERMSCERVPNRPIENCTPPSAEFRQSFADATVKRVALKPHHHARAEFSNGESVEFEGPAPWYIAERSVKKITRSHGTGATHRLSEERIEQAGNDFAALFAEGGFKPGLWHYMGQPAGERMDCERVGNNPIKNCTPVSAEFRRIFDGATVERVVVSEDHRHARAEFSNGESVEFEGQRADEGDKGEGWGNWAYFITETWIKNAGRR